MQASVVPASAPVAGIIRSTVKTIGDAQPTGAVTVRAPAEEQQQTKASAKGMATKKGKAVATPAAEQPAAGNQAAAGTAVILQSICIPVTIHK